MSPVVKIGLGGGCHWCTEGVFSSLKGIEQVDQGWISAADLPEKMSEAVIVHFNPEIIPVRDILVIHLMTHSSSSAHSMRAKYRSAVYTFDEIQFTEVELLMTHLKKIWDKELVTEILFFQSFKKNSPKFTDYFLTRPNAVFCKRYIHPKLALLKAKYGRHLDLEKLNKLGIQITE